MDRSRVTLLAVILVFVIIAVDHTLELGIVTFLGDFLVVFVVLAIALGIIGVKMNE